MLAKYHKLSQFKVINIRFLIKMFQKINNNKNQKINKSNQQQNSQQKKQKI